MFRILEIGAGLWHGRESQLGPALGQEELCVLHLGCLPMMIEVEEQVPQRQMCQGEGGCCPKCVPDC